MGKIVDTTYLNIAFLYFVHITFILKNEQTRFLNLILYVPFLSILSRHTGAVYQLQWLVCMVQLR